MATGVEILNKYRSLNIRTAIQETLQETENSALDLQAEQMYEGKRSTGGMIRPLYSPITIQIKQEKGQVSDRVTLNDTGVFYRSLYMRITPYSFEFLSNDIKRFDIEGKYGAWIYGLSPEMRKRYVSEVLKFHFPSAVLKQLM